MFIKAGHLSSLSQVSPRHFVLENNIRISCEPGFSPFENQAAESNKHTAVPYLISSRLRCILLPAEKIRLKSKASIFGAGYLVGVMS